MASSEENALRPETPATSPETPDWHQGVLVKGTPETPVHLTGDSGLEKAYNTKTAGQEFLGIQQHLSFLPFVNI